MSIQRRHRRERVTVKRVILSCVLCALGATFAISRAEVPLLDKGEMNRLATHIVAGKLKTRFQSVERDQDFETVQGIAEILPDSVEKGQGLKPGEVVFVRYWTKRWVGKGTVPPHSGGHHVPPAGKKVRAWLKRQDDGSFEVLLPNGMIELK